MAKKLKLLDLFCGAGGASVGYSRAGFEVVGVDLMPQPHYPLDFIQADALEYVQAHGDEYDVIAASPPCQAYAKTNRLNYNEHPDLVDPVRELIKHKPYIIENVVGAPLIDPVLLCGSMFGLRVYRHRLFESNIHFRRKPHPIHQWPIAKMGRPPQPGEFMHVVGNFSGVEYAKQAMGIDWMVRDELAQAIPPAYTEFIGNKILQQLG